MVIYYVMLACIAVFYCVCKKFVAAEKSNQAFCALTAVMLIAIVGLRDWQTVGVDLGRYNYVYTQVSQVPLKDILLWRDGLGIMYFVVSSLCSVLGVPYEVFIFGCTALFIGTSVYLISKHTKFPLLGILIYLGMGVFTFQFSGLKQSFAMAFAVFAFDAMTKRKDWWALLWICIATLFHPTSIVLLPLWAASKIRWSRMITLLSLVVTVIIGVFRLQIGELLTNISGGAFAGRYEISGSIGGTAILLIGFLAMYLICFWKDLEERKTSHALVQAALTFAVMIQICSAYSYSFTRLNLFYICFLPVAVSEIMCSDIWSKIFRKYEKVFKAIFAAGIALIMVKQYLSHMHAESLSNFQFLWNQ